MTTSLLIFAKAPEPGLSKTRLIPLLDAQEAAAAHEQLSRRIFQALATSQLSIVLWGASQHPTLVDWAAQCGWPLRQQQGDDLGERMAQALADGQDILVFYLPAWVAVGLDDPLDSYRSETTLNGLLLTLEHALIEGENSQADGGGLIENGIRHGGQIFCCTERFQTVGGPAPLHDDGREKDVCSANVKEPLDERFIGLRAHVVNIRLYLEMAR